MFWQWMSLRSVFQLRFGSTMIRLRDLSCCLDLFFLSVHSLWGGNSDRRCPGSRNRCQRLCYSLWRVWDYSQDSSHKQVSIGKETGIADSCSSVPFTAFWCNVQIDMERIILKGLSRTPGKPEGLLLDIFYQIPCKSAFHSVGGNVCSDPCYIRLTLARCGDSCFS